MSTATRNNARSIDNWYELLGLNRTSLYYEPAGESAFNLALMRLIDEQYTRTPFYGWPRMTAYLRRRELPVNHKRVQRLMQRMGLMAHGFMYLVAIIDWFSRYVLAWQLSNTLDGRFCLDALQRASVSAWTGRVVPWTTFSSSASGGQSSTRIST